jgi:hypothetical protein
MRSSIDTTRREQRHGLVSTNWFKPSVFQTDKENQKCAGDAHSKRTVSTVPVDPTSFSWWWFSMKLVHE